MRFIALFFILGCLTLSVRCLIIPEELPSILSLIYSNIPPIKKGTDSRVGFGFRLGPHADFQVLLELGPQNSTDPLGLNNESPAKRETLVMQNPQKLVDYVNKFNNYVGSSTKGKKKEKNPDTLGGKWIDWWKSNVLNQNSIGKIKFNKVPGIDDLSAEGSENVDFEVEDPTIKKEDMIVNHLRKLYKAKPNVR